MTGLVLSLFPGIGLLDMAFEEEGFCVVRGPDLLWGGDIRRFHPPAGKFDGVIGGDPCQAHSQYRFLNPKSGQRFGDLTPEYARVVNETRPRWFLRENVRHAPDPVVPGYTVQTFLLNNRWLGAAQDRMRKFWFGTQHGGCRMHVETVALEPIEYRQAVTSSLRAVSVKLGGSGRPKRTYSDQGGPRAALEEMLTYQGLPADFFGDDSPLTQTGKRNAIGNGVPLAMGRAVAKAVKRALEAAP